MELVTRSCSCKCDELTKQAMQSDVTSAKNYVNKHKLDLSLLVLLLLIT